MGSRLQDRVTWVIGASGALGAAIARAAAEEGSRVVASGRDAGKLGEVVAAISGAGGHAEARVVDVCDRTAVDAAAADIATRLGRIDGLVNSTSLSIFGDFLELADDDWRQVLDAKLLGYVRTMRAVLPQMVRQGGGSIVNLSGRGGRQPTPAHLPGGCANAAVNLLTKGVADAQAGRGIRANVVAPGPIASARLEKIRASNERVAGGELPRMAYDRKGQPEDVAEAVIWLLSDAARHVNGAVIPVDGGSIATV